MNSELQSLNSGKPPSSASTFTMQFDNEPSDPKKILTRNEYEELKEESGTMWNTLPDSVIGTLIYFLLIENNDRNFKLCETIRSLVLIGFPVYYTYVIQFNILYELWESLPALGDVENSGLCTMDISIELAASSVFFIFIFPNCVTVIQEAAIVITCYRAALTEYEYDDRVVMVDIHAPMSKRVFIWFAVCFAEICLLITLCFVGTQFILTSQNIAAIVLDSVAIVFVMDIDNYAREAFQAESISEHVDSVYFDTRLKAPPEEKNEGEPREVTLEILMTFWSLEKAFMVVTLTCTLVFMLRHFNCIGIPVTDDNYSSSYSG